MNKEKHLFPWWAGYLLIIPLRKFSLDPDKFFRQYIKEGMTVIDAGCAMGYFSLPAARLVGRKGLVICVDLQERMLTALKKRAIKAGLEKQIETRLCKAESLMIDDLSGKADLAHAFAVLHEVPNEDAFLTDLSSALKSGGTFILGEPKKQVSSAEFMESVRKTGACGLKNESVKEYNSFRIAVFTKS